MHLVKLLSVLRKVDCVCCTEATLETLERFSLSLDLELNRGKLGFFSHAYLIRNEAIQDVARIQSFDIDQCGTKTQKGNY